MANSTNTFELCSKPVADRREFWKQKNIGVQFIENGPNIDEISKKWNELAKSGSAFLTDFQFGKKLMEIIPEIPELIRETGILDAGFFHENRWWAHCFFREALHELVASRAKDLDIFAKAYITGAGPSTTIVLSTLVRMGYRSIVLVSDDQTETQKLITEFRRRHFDVKIESLRELDLAMQSNDGSVLVNQVEIQPNSSWIESLSYLNFIGANGLVIDINYPPFTHQVLDEAEVVNLRTIKGVEIRGLADWLWLKTADPQLQISKQEYMTSWIEFTKAKNPTKV